MKYLALAVLLTVAQRSAPVPRQAANGSASAGQSVHNKTTRDKAPPTQPQIGSNANETPKHEAAGSDQATESKKEDVNLTKLPIVSVEPDYGTWVFSGLLVIVGVIQAILLYRTWGQIERQAGIMGEQAGEMKMQREIIGGQLITMQGQVAEMGKQTTILATSVETARATAEAARDSVEMFINKERARLRIEVKPLSFVMQDRGLMDSVHYKIHFHGQTEAFVLESACYAVVNDSETLDITDDIVKLFKMDIPPVIGPSTVLPDRFTFLYHGPGLTLTQAARDEIANGKRFAHFYAFIKYRDVFDRTRDIQLCYLWQVNLSLNALLPKGIKGDKWVESGPLGTNRDT